jgi:pantetheine-phosphate adenylyltransferase
MSMAKKAIYAGSFDPLTNGHIWVIEKSFQMFDSVLIAVGVNAKKKSYFSVDDRLAMINEWIESQGFAGKAFVQEPIAFENEFLVDVAKRNGCDYMVRGIRNVTDFSYEIEIKNFNDKLNPNIDTVFLVPPTKLVGVSSSIVRGCVGLNNWEASIKDCTTPYVIQNFKERLA